MKKTTIFITHDLDEAVRVGHRIAIMRDGQVIQVGTPEEIILNPVDEYVKEFVKGISRLISFSEACLSCLSSSGISPYCISPADHPMWWLGKNILYTLGTEFNIV
ncbi:hypothetical protein [Chryseobacterium cucumeris]|uniref:hypothetical protein n=1 Tax=Chryseobacterium cucumeris TaxID=1813611 RepID=UPI0023F4F5D8|nr:hypothetical protein [Chryseobacterium cucumeris]